MAEFALVSVGDPEGAKLLEKAKKMMNVPNSCWQKAYRDLFARCSEIMEDKEKHNRLAWNLNGCYRTSSGQSPLPSCSEKTSMAKCLMKVDEHERQNHLSFFHQANSICLHLQANAFNQETERLVNELARSARSAEEKLEVIEERSKDLIRGSEKVQDSLSVMDIQTQKLSKRSESVDSQIHNVLKHSEAIFEQSKGIAASQVDMKEQQSEMKEKMESNMAILRESYETLNNGLDNLKKEAMEIEKEILEIGESITSKMGDLQRKADEIGSAAGDSLDKQKKVLEGQAAALDGLDFLTKFQTQALQESRAAMDKLSEFGKKQKEELMRKQEVIQAAHDRLMRNSQAILEAQEVFESKQANIFAALDKLHALHGALLAESRFIKSFFFYACVIFLLYMLTSTKQTFSIRARLYIGLCIAFLLEMAIVRQRNSGEVRQQERITSEVFFARSSFLVFASVQIVYSIFTYRDYEILNHRLLQSLIEKVEFIHEHNSGKFLDSSSMVDQSDSDLKKYSWIFDEELREEVNSRVDPNYLLPEGIGENSFGTSPAVRSYDLRPRRGRRSSS